MNILIVHNQYRYRGGEEIYISNLSTHLKNKGHNVYIYEKDSRTISLKPISLIQIITCSFYSQRIESELDQIIAQFKPHIVHVHNIFPLIGPTIYFICKKHNIPIVQTIHNYRILGKQIQNKFLSVIIKINQFIMKKNNIYQDSIDQYIFPSNYTKNRILKSNLIPQSKTIVIPNMTIQQKKHNSIIPKLNNFFLFVGRLSKEKGILELLTVFKELPTFNLIVIGRGPLEHAVLQYKQYKNIHINSHLDPSELQPYYKNAMATIIPSDPLFEVCPLVLIESFAVGTPVLVPNGGAFQEMVKHGKSGLFFNQEDHNSLKKRIKQFAQISTEERNAMKKFILKEFKNKFSSDAHYFKIMTLYKQLTHEKN